MILLAAQPTAGAAAPLLARQDSSSPPAATQSSNAGGVRRTASDPVQLDAASSDVDYKTNTVVFRDVVVSQGAIRVTAEQARATGLNFDDAVWTFSGRVRIAVDGGALSSDQATVNFAANRILRATILGNPAQFEQPRPETGDIARGRAGSIEYNVSGGTVTLSRDAWLTDGRNEIRGQQLVYDVREQRVKAQSAPDGTERVKITIRPRETAPGSGAR
jgi:lipopolysaccharide transport protein LptA